MSSKARRSRSDDLNSYFDRSANAVKDYADVLEHNYARPALRVGSAYYDQHPVVSVFLVILFCLSIVPILTFIGFSIFAGVSFAIIALSCALGAFIFVELVFVSVLLCVLIAVVCMSGFLTGATIFTYLFVRLVVLVRYEGRSGFSTWMLETKGRYGHNRELVISKGETYASPYGGDEDQQDHQGDVTSGFETEEILSKEEDTSHEPQQREEL